MTLGMNLQRFPMEVVEYVTDPVTGIQTRSKFPPNVPEVIEACRFEMEHREKVRRFTSMPPPLPRLPASPLTADQSYEKMFKAHGRPYGAFELGRQLSYRS
jgi:hypothetical protein